MSFVRSFVRGPRGATLVVALLVTACSGGGAATAQPSATPPPSTVPTTAAAPTASPSATAAPTASPSPSPSVATGPATLTAPREVEAGAQFEVAWTGPNAPKDYVTIVPAAATEWTSVDPYFYTTNGSPGKLVAPTTAGPFALWYVSGADDAILARLAISVTPFTGDLLAPESVPAGSVVEVSWNGPNGPKDYVTIIAVGAERWTNESYFYTNAGNPGKLVAPIVPGSYEIRYVTGDDKTQARRPITVGEFEITLKAPAKVAKGAPFDVEWTGPNGPSDYITIVPAGSPPGTYASYAYTAAGSPAHIIAPDKAGEYEIWYASDRVAGIFASTKITVE